jgi:hypothetical protein
MDLSGAPPGKAARSVYGGVILEGIGELCAPNDGASVVLGLVIFALWAFCFGAGG